MNKPTDALAGPLHRVVLNRNKESKVGNILKAVAEENGWDGFQPAEAVRRPMETDSESDGTNTAAGPSAHPATHAGWQSAYNDYWAY